MFKNMCGSLLCNYKSESDPNELNVDGKGQKPTKNAVSDIDKASKQSALEQMHQDLVNEGIKSVRKSANSRRKNKRESNQHLRPLEQPNDPNEDNQEPAERQSGRNQVQDSEKMYESVSNNPVSNRQSEQNQI